ncbi:MAG: hypothetical protein AB7P41_05660 [Dehalococcoidia bacterium]
MAVQGLDTLGTLASHHLPAMDLFHKRCLLLRASGKTEHEAAQTEGVSVGTMKLRLNVASAEIAMCLSTGQRLTGEMRGGWVQAHLECCLADALTDLMRGSA